MIIKLLSGQIPTFWEAIKFGATQADEVDEKDLQPYLNELLHALLSDKAQCFVGLDDKRSLVGVLVTRIGIDKITGDKFLFIQSVYTWERLEDSVWKETYDLFSQFALKEQCKYLSFSSRNPAIWDRTEKLGFKERTRTYTLQLS
jgi:hypothetical protein